MRRDLWRSHAGQLHEFASPIRARGLAHRGEQRGLEFRSIRAGRELRRSFIGKWFLVQAIDHFIRRRVTTGFQLRLDDLLRAFAERNGHASIFGGITNQSTQHFYLGAGLAIARRRGNFTP